MQHGASDFAAACGFDGGSEEWCLTGVPPRMGPYRKRKTGDLELVGQENEGFLALSAPGVVGALLPARLRRFPKSPLA